MPQHIVDVTLNLIRNANQRTIHSRVPVLSCLLAFLITSLSGGVARAGFDEIGGPDVQVARTDITPGTTPVIDIRDNGEMYVAVNVAGAEWNSIAVYRSQDGGEHWQYWGGLDSTGVDYREPSLQIAEGDQNRLYLAFSYKGPSETHREIRVAASPFTTSASWTIHTALTSRVDDFDQPCLSSDETNFSAYRLYVAARGNDGNGHDIWFTRSTNYSVAWDAGYKIASLTTGDDYTDPAICYGSSGVVHCTWTYVPQVTPGKDKAVMYRRAVNYAAGAGDWQTAVLVTSDMNGQDEITGTVAASHGTSTVLMSYGITEGINYYGSELRQSTTAGATWSAPVYMDVQVFSQPMAYPGAGGFSLLGDYYGGYTGFRSSSESDPLAMSDHKTIVDTSHPGAWGWGAAARRQDYDEAQGNRRAMVTMGFNPSGPDTVWFDAEWRGEPGYPYLEPGFPVSVTSGICAPPAICNLDNDDESEIVCGTSDGHIIVVNHDGTPVPGWPAYIGALQADATIAVGSIVGNGDNEVVAGNNAGVIYAFDRTGSLLPGWPQDMGTGQPCYLALGAIVGPQRQVVACSGNKIAVYNGDGSLLRGFPLTVAGTISAPPAIGDVNGDGNREFVILQTDFMDVIRGDGTVAAWRYVGPDGQTFSNAPTLADLNLDGDLEIMAPTDQGRLYVMNPDGTNYPGGWPYIDPAGTRLTSVALAQFRAGLEPELIFNEEESFVSQVHAFYQNKTELSGYPHAAGSSLYIYAMPTIDILAGGSGDAIVPTRDFHVYGWDNFGASLPGWPYNIWARCNVSAASGDIDNDGRVEVVFCGFDPAQILVYDTQGPIDRSSMHKNAWWPMYAYNPLREGCLACDNDYVSAVDDAPPVAAISFEAPGPNPTTGGAVSLRFTLPEPAAVRLDVFDTQGRLIDHVLKDELPAGPHAISWTPRSEAGPPLASGVYYVKLVVSGPNAGRELTRKVIVTR